MAREENRTIVLFFFKRSRACVAEATRGRAGAGSSARKRVPEMVPGAGFEPACPCEEAADFKSAASADFAIRADGALACGGRRLAGMWRRDPESNRTGRICNPLHNRFAIAPCAGITAGTRCYQEEREAEASLFNRASGAGNETRTRDLNLGKVALYQLSYSRMVSTSASRCAAGVKPRIVRYLGRLRPPLDDQ